MDQIMAEPLWLVIWVFTLMVLNSASLLFIKRIEARWVLVAWLINLPVINYIYETQGYVRLLGLSHVLVWTPLVVYLWLRRTHWMPPKTLTEKWILAVFMVNLVSLIIDYIDVTRWLIGERGGL